MQKIPNWMLIAAVALAVVTVFVLAQPRQMAPRAVEVPYSEFKRLAGEGALSQVTFRGNAVQATLVEAQEVGALGRSAGAVASRVPDLGDPELLPLLESKNVMILSLPSEDDGPFSWLVSLLPWILILGVYLWFWNRMQKGMMGRLGGRDISDFLSGSATKEEKRDEKVTFDDVAGQENAKREVSELVDFLTDPDRYTRLGPNRRAGFS